MTADDEGQIDEEDFRIRLRALLAARKDLTCAGLSRALGRNHAYLQQYLTRRSPRRLPLEDKWALARLAGIAPHGLGLPAPPARRDDGPFPHGGMPIFTAREAEPLRAWLRRTGGSASESPSPHRPAPGAPEPASDSRAPARTAEPVLRAGSMRLGPWLAAAFGERVFGFLAPDQALAPAVRAGDLLFVDARHRHPHDDGLYLCDLGRAGVAVRRLFRRPRDRVLLVADNAPALAAQEVPLAGLVICGRVVAVLRPLAGGWPRPCADDAVARG